MSIALRNLVLFVGAAAMMVVTSPRLSGLILLVIPAIVLPIVAFGRNVRRRSREAQDRLADASAFAAEAIGGVRTVQAFTLESQAGGRFAALVEQAFGAARGATAARAGLTAIAIFLVFASVVGGALVGRACGAARRDVGRRARPVRALFGLRGGRARRAFADVGRGLAGGGGDGAHRRADGDPRRASPRPSGRSRFPRRRRATSPSTTSISATATAIRC